MPCARPARCVERVSSSRSSGPTNVENRSRNKAFAATTTSRRSSCTSVLNTIGRRPSSSAARLMRRTTSCALSRLDTNGKVIGRNSSPSNCVMRLWPSVSAVTPVWSETKNTVRRLTRRAYSSRLLRRVRSVSPGVQVPGGFATTAHAYREFLAQGGLDARIRGELAALDVDDVTRLAATGARIRQWILATPFPPALTAAVSAQLQRMSASGDLAVAVRSSATAEDLPEASFAGQQESFLNVRGESAVLKAMHEVFASLFNDRAISYRVHQGFDHAAVALSAGVQHMVRSDLGASGVMFTLDPDSGFRDVVLITAAWGLGETVVQGAVNPMSSTSTNPHCAPASSR